MNEIEQAVEKLAKKAGQYALEKSHDLSVSSKGDDYRNLVTNVDIEVSEMLKAEIRELFPEHAFYSEEEPGVIDKEKYTWVIDPIDGTSNYARSIPYYSSVVTVMKSGQVVTSVVFSPVLNECYQVTASGVTLNGEAISASSTDKLKQAYVNFHPGRKSELRDWVGETKIFLLGEAKKSINLASSALDLCYIANGRMDVLIYGTLTTIDIAGAIEMVRRAGGEVYNYDTREPVALTTEPQRIIATATSELLEDYFEKLRN
jgi:myo-inositol-1(or 4)-monophosphatase